MPVITYGAETQMWTKKDTSRLQSEGAKLSYRELRNCIRKITSKTKTLGKIWNWKP